jgi:acyl dehydratase
VTEDLDLGLARYWDDVDVGDDIEGPTLTLDWTTMVLQVSGSQDWSTVHHDPDFARESGHPEPFYNTGWTAALLARTITDWMGPSGWLCRLEFQMRQMNVRGDTVRGRGRILEKHLGPDGGHLVELDVWLENDRLGVTTPAKAVVNLPVRSAS